MAWEGRKRPTQADHHLPATTTSLLKSSANIAFLQRKALAKELQTSLW